MEPLVLVGEAWGKDEEAMQHPFVGASGSILIDMLDHVGLIELTAEDLANRQEFWRSRNPYFNTLIWKNHPEIYLTNVFNVRPQPTNAIINLCGPKAQGIQGFPSLTKGKYVRSEFALELERLYQEIDEIDPNLIVALGATPTWALMKIAGIKNVRGATEYALSGHKILPTYHPAAVMREWKLYPIVIADLTKAKEQADFPEVRRKKRNIYTYPNIEDIEWFISEHIEPSSELSIDIETIGDIITCIGFACSDDCAMVVPFYDALQDDKNYWRSHKDEVRAWGLVRYICSLDKPVVFQNGMYDLQFLWMAMGIPVPHATHDTMLLHHALQPEMEKGLGFQASVYTNESAWKFTHKTRTIKKEG